MKIYTKVGDFGETALYGGAKVAKDHLRIRAYGTVDELNASLGVVLAQKLSKNLKTSLLEVQNELFRLGAELATPRGKNLKSRLIGISEITRLEKEIDAMEKKLKPLKNFILPGGSAASAHLHQARTICRRAEREIVTIHRAEPLRPEVLQYMNRLSDYLFVCARTANRDRKIADILWTA